MYKTSPERLYLIDLSDTVPEGEVLFELLLNTKFEYNFRNKSYTVNILKGFKTNFGSIPKHFRNIISNVSKHNKAFLLHDYYYSKNCKEVMTRLNADILLKEMLKFDGMGIIDRNLVYYSVKYFGKEYWKRD